jgi:hypothetical protein
MTPAPSPSRRIGSLLSALTFAAMTPVVGGCSGVTGEYADQTGLAVLNLKDGGEATFAMSGNQAACTYKVDGTTLNLDCKAAGGPMTMTIKKDGTISGPPDGGMPVLRKR